MKYDRVFEMVDNVVEDIKKTQTNMKLRSMAYAFNDEFINGDHATNVDSPEGLNKRIASYLPSRQSLSIGTAFDVTLNVASEHKLIDYIHDLMDRAGLRDAPMVQVKKGDKQPARTGALLMNRDMYLGFGRVARRAGVLMTTQDSWGRLFDSFAGVPIIDVGLKPDKSTEIITNTYGGSSNETRIFAVRFGEEDGLTGIQLNSLDAYDPIAAGEGAGNVTGPQRLLRIDWWHGYAGYGSYYASRLTGVLTPVSWT